MSHLPANISEDALLALVREHFGDDVVGGSSFDEIGSRLQDPEALGMGSLRYWEDLKNEFHDLLCTDSKKYADVRGKFGGLGKKSELSLIGLLSASMAPHIGVSAAALGPFCALCLVAVLRLGKEAFCRSWSLSSTLEIGNS